MKRCPRCGEVKPREGFHKHKNMADGLQNECIDCRHVRLTSPEYRNRKREYDAERRKKPEVKERRRIQAYDYFLNNREYYRSVGLTNSYIRKFKLKERGIATVYPDPTPFADIVPRGN